MKLSFLFISICFSLLASAQGDKSLRPSPPAQAKATLKSGATITIDYSQPALKGRTIGKDVEPYNGKVWRTGANEATVFETNQDVKIGGQGLPAGKYALFSIMDGDEWTIILNKTWKQWGAFNYKEADDVLRVKAKAEKASAFSERLTFYVNDEGKVSFVWGETEVKFKIE